MINWVSGQVIRIRHVGQTGDVKMCYVRLGGKTLRVPFHGGLRVGQIVAVDLDLPSLKHSYR